MNKVKAMAEIQNAEKEHRTADLRGADLRGADLRWANLREANLREADLREADLRGADLRWANLREADLRWANLREADLHGANLREASLRWADLRWAKMPVHRFQAAPGGVYWKGIGEGLINRGYQYSLDSVNGVADFNDDQRVLCASPGLHFATKEWVLRNWTDCKYLAKVQVPINARINNPWATDGKASADKLIILDVYNMKTGEKCTDEVREMLRKKEVESC